MEIKEQAIQNLKDIKQILDDLNITFWLDCGTCLGAYRDKDFCDGDEDDIDLSCWDNHLFLMDEIIKRAEKIGFFVHHKWELEVALKRNKSKIDLFFNRKNKQEAYTYLYSGDNIVKTVVVPIKHFEALDRIKFCDEDFFIPGYIEEYLTLRYGDWKTPIHRSQYSCVNPEQNLLSRDTYV